MAKRKASLGLDSVENINEKSDTQTVQYKPNIQVKKKVKKKQHIPVYIDPLLHEALHVLVFSERQQKTTFQSLFIEGLDLLLKKRGLPSVRELSSGEKTINL